MRTPPRILDRGRHADERRHPADAAGRAAATRSSPRPTARRRWPRRASTARPDPARRHDAEARRDRGLPPAQGGSVASLHRRSSWSRPRPIPKDIVAGLEAGGDEYLTKPVDQAALVARVKSMLRIKALHDTVQDAGRGARRVEPDARAAASQDQVGQLERLGRLKRFFSPQLAELIVSGGAEDPLQTPPARDHRRLPRPARLHRLRRDRRARGSDGRPPRVPRRDGQAHPGARGHARALHRATA